MVNVKTELIQEIQDLGTTPKQLSDEAIVYLKNEVLEYQKKKQTNDFVECLPFIVGFVYNEAYRCATEDVIRLIREK